MRMKTEMRMKSVVGCSEDENESCEEYDGGDNDDERDYVWIHLDYMVEEDKAKTVPKTRLMSMEECCNLGFSGWTHHATHPDEPNLLLLKDPDADDPDLYNDEQVQSYETILNQYTQIAHLTAVLEEKDRQRQKLKEMEGKLRAELGGGMTAAAPAASL